jgi:hypothetical protein
MARQYKQLPDIEVAVKDGVVIKLGTFTRVSELLFMESRVAEIEGVVRILIDSRFPARTRMPES